MKDEYSITQARENLFDLIRRVETGGQIRISRRGRVVARLIGEPGCERTVARKQSINWGNQLVDLRNFKFDRDDANAR
jgi:prevent-host-death family protein